MRNFVSFRSVKFDDGFWQNRYNLNKTVSINAVRDRFEETARFDALRFNYLKNGKSIHYFYDSDVAKWIEGVAYLIEHDREAMKENEALIDELVLDMERAQRDDGYLNSYHQQIEPHNIFKLRDHHELYCCGHLVEAAIAYHKATGKRKLLDIMEKYLSCIEKAFIIDKTASFVTPGHEEIELALYRLYEHTGNEKYRKMAEFFLLNRGMTEKEEKHINLQDESIYEITSANGHAVRALYLYSGIADMARVNGDERLKKMLNVVWENIVTKKTYITGGVGSSHRGESFTVAYDLPNITAYSESCCAIAMIMLAMRMRGLEKNADYGDIIERVLYNSLLSSTALDGKSFFYSNPLEIALEEVDREKGVYKGNREWLPARQRVEVFNCSCCPPNINRIFASLGDTVCFEDEICFIEQYIPSVVESKYGTLFISGEYAVDGKVCVSSRGYKKDRIAFRMPSWSKNPTVKVNGRSYDFTVEDDGYLYVPVSADFTVELNFNIRPVFIASNPLVRHNAGRVALTFGPIVYCVEGVDNGDRLNRISVDIRSIGTAKSYLDFHGLNSIELDGFIDKEDNRLYLPAEESGVEKKRLKFIPYFAFANRGESDMLVWIRRK